MQNRLLDGMHIAFRRFSWQSQLYLHWVYIIGFNRSPTRSKEGKKSSHFLYEYELYINQTVLGPRFCQVKAIQWQHLHWHYDMRWIVAFELNHTATHLYDVRVGSALVGFIVLGVFQKDFVHVGAGILKQLVGAVKDDEGDFTVTQNAQLIGLLHQTKLPLHESHLERQKPRINLVFFKHQLLSPNLNGRGKNYKKCLAETSWGPTSVIQLSPCSEAHFGQTSKLVCLWQCKTVIFQLFWKHNQLLDCIFFLFFTLFSIT